MTGTERGFLLLSSQLGDPERKPLSTAAMRQLAGRVKSMEKPVENRDLQIRDLQALGYNQQMAQHILNLLGEEELLAYYLRKASHAGCVPLARISEEYPSVLRARLGDESPFVLWAKGNISILKMPMVALVGSRDIRMENKAFAAEVGMQAAKQGYALVSGNARGADRIAQNACLDHGGCVVSVVADMLTECKPCERVLYLSEEDFDAEFSAQRALSRNRVIHALGKKTFVAQCSFGSGGTWDGTVKNLKHGWSPVFCFQDGSDATVQLVQMGAQEVSAEGLHNLNSLVSPFVAFFDQ